MPGLRAHGTLCTLISYGGIGISGQLAFGIEAKISKILHSTTHQSISSHLDGLPLLVPLLPALDKDVETEHEEDGGHEGDRHGHDAQPPCVRLVQRAAGWQFDRNSFRLSFGLKNGLTCHFDSGTCLNYPVLNLV